MQACTLRLRHAALDHPLAELQLLLLDSPIDKSYRTIRKATMSKTILVTGASRGIGLACARILIEEFKCNIVTLSRSLSAELQDLQKEYQGRIEVVQGDVSSEEDQKVRNASGI